MSIILSPATSLELLSHIVAHQRYPTTIIIAWPKQDFLAALVQDAKDAPSLQDPPSSGGSETTRPQRRRGHDLLHASLLQKAVSRHIRLAFVPTVTHLRAYLTAFTSSDSRIPAPPNNSRRKRDDDDYGEADQIQIPALLVYGLLELHRYGSEWSAQGLGITIAALVEAAARNSLRPAIVEPRGRLGHESLDDFLNDNVPLLSSGGSGNGITSQKQDVAPWKRRAVPVRRVLGRWFQFETAKEEGA